MLLPTHDTQVKQLIENSIFAAKQGAITITGATNHILSYLEKEGYHKGLPTSVEEALNSGDGVYRP